MATTRPWQGRRRYCCRCSRSSRRHCCHCHRSELHEVWPVAVAQGEAGAQVALQLCRGKQSKRGKTTGKCLGVQAHKPARSESMRVVILCIKRGTVPLPLTGTRIIKSQAHTSQQAAEGVCTASVGLPPTQCHAAMCANTDCQLASRSGFANMLALAHLLASC